MVLDRNVLFALSYSMSRKSWLLLQPVSNVRLAGIIMTVKIACCCLQWRRSVKENCCEIDVYIYSCTLRDNYHCVNLYLVFKKCVFCSLRYFDIHIIKPVILLWMKLMHLFRWKRNKGDCSTPQKVSIQNNTKTIYIYIHIAMMLYHLLSVYDTATYMNSTHHFHLPRKVEQRTAHTENW